MDKSAARHPIIATLKQDYQSFDIYSFRTINSLKTAIAALIGYMLIHLFHWTQGQWVVITILVVMSAQSTLGSLLIKSHMRFWGTVVGATSSFFILLFLAGNFVAIGFILFFLIILFSYVAGGKSDLKDSGTLASVTMAIILLSKYATPMNAIYRFAEISTGILIALLVSRYIFPLRANQGLNKLISKNLQSLATHFEKCLILNLGKKNMLKFSNIEQNIISNFEDQFKMIHNLETEPGKTRKLVTYYKRILIKQRKLYRGINSMNYAANMLPQAKANQISFDCVVELLKQMNEQLKLSSEALITKDLQLLSNMKRLTLDDLKKSTDTQPKVSDDNEIIAFKYFIFSAELFTHELSRLIYLLKKIIKEST